MLQEPFQDRAADGRTDHHATQDCDLLQVIADRCRARIPGSADERAESIQDVYARVLVHVTKLKTDLSRFLDSREAVREVVWKKVEARRSQVRRGRKKAALSLTDLAVAAPADRGAVARETIQAVSERLDRVGLSKQERAYAGLLLAGCEDAEIATLMGLHTRRVANLKNKATGKLRALVEQLL